MYAYTTGINHNTFFVNLIRLVCHFINQRAFVGTAKVVCDRDIIWVDNYLMIHTHHV